MRILHRKFDPTNDAAPSSITGRVSPFKSFESHQLRSRLGSIVYSADDTSDVVPMAANVVPRPGRIALEPTPDGAVGEFGMGDGDSGAQDVSGCTAA